MQREPVVNRLGEVRFVFNDEYANDSSLGRLCGGCGPLRSWPVVVRPIVARSG